MKNGQYLEIFVNYEFILAIFKYTKKLSANKQLEVFDQLFLSLEGWKVVPTLSVLRIFFMTPVSRFIKLSNYFILFSKLSYDTIKNKALY